jgi:hypothetical protein
MNGGVAPGGRWRIARNLYVAPAFRIIGSLGMSL